MAKESEPSTSNPTLRARPRQGVALLLLLAVLVFFGEALVTGRVPAMRDLVFDFVPWREFAAQALADGEIPLWNHHSRCGQPFLANPQSAVLYPPNLVFLLLPAAAALTASLALHALLLIGSTYALVRRLGLDRPPALLCAGALGLGTYTVAMMEFLTSFTTVAWLPLTWLAADALVAAARRAGQWRLRAARCAPATGVLTLLFALQALAGHPQSLLQNMLLVVVFALVRAAAGRDRPAVVATLAGLAVAAVCSMGLAAPQILSTLDLVPLSTRAGAIDPGMAEASVHPSHLLTLLLPGLYGGPGYAGEWWSDHVYEYWASTSYVGVAPLVLASFLPLLWRRPRSPRALRTLTLLFAAVALLGLLLAFGRRTPLYPLLVDHLPLFDRFRWPGKLLHYVAFSLPVLGALGFHAALRARRRWLLGVALAWGALWLCVAGLRAAGGDAALPPRADAEQVRSAMTWLLTVLGASVAGVALLAGRMRAVGVALLVITSFVDPGAVSRGNLPFLEPTVYSSRPDWIDEYRAAAPGRVHTIYQRAQLVLYGTRDAALLHWARRAAVGETLLPSRVDHTWGFGQLPLRGWAEAWTMLDDPDGDARVRRRLADAMNVRHVVFGAPFTQEAVRDGIRPETRWVEQEGAAPRAMLTTRWQVAAGADDARDRLLAGATAVLHAQDGEDAPPVPGETRGAAGAVTALEYDWNRVSIGVRTDAPALLVLTDTWHPGWTAHVDGRETPVLRANWLFRGVLVPAGARRVEMAYEDAGFRRGLLVALVAGALLIALMLGARRLGSEA